MGVANAVNLIDGMDGLAAGVTAISSLTIWAVALAPSINQPYAALIAAVLAGALLGFLRWNFNPAHIFIGDSGAYLVGFILGAVSITGVLKGATAATVIVPTFVLVLLILFFPLLDTAWAILAAWPMDGRPCRRMPNTFTIACYGLGFHKKKLLICFTVSRPC